MYGKQIDTASFVFDGVSYIKINNVFGSPVVGFGTTATVSLRSERIGTTGSDCSWY